MTKYLHICFEDGTEICVSLTEAEFYIEKYAADGIAVTSGRLTNGIDLVAEMDILGFDYAVVDARLARLDMAVGT
jgi:hypothetical protein